MTRSTAARQQEEPSSLISVMDDPQSEGGSVMGGYVPGTDRLLAKSYTASVIVRLATDVAIQAEITITIEDGLDRTPIIRYECEYTWGVMKYSSPTAAGMWTANGTADDIQIVVESMARYASPLIYAHMINS